MNRFNLVCDLVCNLVCDFNDHCSILAFYLVFYLGLELVYLGSLTSIQFMYDFDLGQSSEIDYEVDDRLTNAFFYRISSWCRVIFTGIPSNCTRDLILTRNMGNLGLIYGVFGQIVDG